MAVPPHARAAPPVLALRGYQPAGDFRAADEDNGGARAMTALALVLVRLAGVPGAQQETAAARLVSAGSRYALSALGPVSVSAAHFIAALIFLHTLPRAAFGQFSFLIIVSAFC